MFPRLPHKLRNELRDLHRAFHREEQQRYLAEGSHICAELLSSPTLVDFLVVREDASQEIVNLASRFAEQGIATYTCGEKDMAFAANTVSAQGIIARVRFHDVSPIGPRVVMLDAVADPGNVGTIIRCATWFGFTDVVLGAECADQYNPKVVRAAAGAMLRMNVHRHQHIAQVLHSLPSHHTVSAVAHGGKPPTVIGSLENVAIVIGSEAHGVSDAVLAATTHHVTIPGVGQAESLNAAMAAAILLYEARASQ